MKSKIDILRDLKADCCNRLVSALVGAGLSRNVSEEYGTWTGLLSDMRKELAADESLSPLVLVDQYIAKKGAHHASVDSYIESHIPCVRKNGSLFQLTLSGNFVPEKYLRVHKSLLACHFGTIMTTNYDNLLEYIDEHAGEHFFKKVVIDRGGLTSVGENPVIVKLHGSLPEERESVPYPVFDSDEERAAYIISSDDFNNYEKRHEPFVNFAKHKLSTGKLLLVGFSGNDPNFENWHKWVLEQFPNETQMPGVYKIYVVAIRQGDFLSDVRRDFETKSIGVIDLWDTEVQKEIFKTDNLNESYEVRDLLSAFFDYLAETADQKNAVTSVNENADENASCSNTKEEYPIWKRIYHALSEKDSKKLGVEVNALTAQRNADKLPKHVSIQREVIESLMWRKSWTKDEEQIFAYAVQDCGLMPNYFRNALPEKHSLASNEVWKELIKQENAFFTELEENAVGGLEEVMVALYALQKETAMTALDSWKTEEFLPQKEILKYAATWSHDGVDVLRSYIDAETTNHERRYLSSIAYRILSDGFVSNPFEEYRKRNVVGFFEVLENIEHELFKENFDLQPLGSSVYTHNMGNHNHAYEQAVRLLSLLYKTGLSPQMSLWTLVNKKTWWKVFELLYEDYPLACMYYTLTYRDNKLVKRAGQYFATSERLHEGLSNALNGLLTAIGEKQCPNQCMASALVLSKELYVSVSETEWYDVFKKYVWPQFEEHLSNLSFHDDLYLHVRSALENVHSGERVRELMGDLLSNLDRNNRVISDLICSRLNVSEMKMDAELHDVLRQMVEEWGLLEMLPICYSLNFYHKLDPTIKRTISHQIENNEEWEKIENYQYIQMSYMVGDDNAIAVLKTAMVHHSSLWDCGFSKEGWTNPDFLDLNRLNESIRWNTEELCLIYENMRQNLKQLLANKRLFDDSVFTFDYVPLAASMQRFTIKHPMSDEVEDIEKLISELCAAITSKSGYTALLLASNDLRELEMGILQLYLMVEQKDWNVCVRYFDILVNRVLQGNKIGMDFCVAAIKETLKFLHTPVDSETKKLIEQLILASKEWDFHQLDLYKPTIEADLTDIAKSVGIGEDGGSETVLVGDVSRRCSVLSIVTINYNDIEGLKKTLASVSSQSFGEFEHIVIDSGSTDGSTEVLNDYQLSVNGRYEVKWVSEKDKGVYNAMNKGIKMASGEYIQILNSGDILANNHVIQSMYERIEEKGLRNKEIIYGNMLKAMPDGKLVRDNCGGSGVGSSFLYFYRGTLNHDCAWIRRDLFNRFGLYDEDMRICSDWKWYVDAIAVGGVRPVYVDIDVTIFDMNGISESGGKNRDLIQKERRDYLEQILPASVLHDYDEFSFPIEQYKRLKRYHLWGFVNLLERVFFKLEKWHILSK